MQLHVAKPVRFELVGDPDAERGHVRASRVMIVALSNHHITTIARAPCEKAARGSIRPRGCDNFEKLLAKR